MKLCMFRTVRLSIIRSLFTIHSAMVYVIQICRQLSSRTRMEREFHPGPAQKLSVWHIPLLSVHWINSWWWTDELSETCRVSWQNKFVKLVHIVGFITKKYEVLMFVIVTHTTTTNTRIHYQYPMPTLFQQFTKCQLQKYKTSSKSIKSTEVYFQWHKHKHFLEA